VAALIEDCTPVRLIGHDLAHEASFTVRAGERVPFVFSWAPSEWQADWLPGYENSAPVRIGNAAVGQLQLDVYGEVIDAITLGRQAGLRFDSHTWSLVRALLRFLERHWTEPDEGIWEVRGPAGTSCTPR
jgi:GH15 family glucan-1,4-alpha-glucosidase